MTTSYAVTNLLLSERSRPSTSLTAEAQYGLDFLSKMWDAKNGVLYAQVGVGGGSSKENFVGDHDVWRLPEADDKLNVKAGDENYYIKYRPVFAANKAGQKISPNLAGRVAAAFAVAAQNLAATDRTKATQYLSTAAAIYGLANTAGGSIVSPTRTATTPSRPIWTTWSWAPRSWRWPRTRWATTAPAPGRPTPASGPRRTWPVVTRARSTSTTPSALGPRRPGQAAAPEELPKVDVTEAHSRGDLAPPAVRRCRRGRQEPVPHRRLRHRLRRGQPQLR
ncbi:glycoside hydrolase family 9 protein, partial [Kutzneria kofuensis]|uniref:glycoside hydrolase family 9 protein n=1 Tax=Kutzneria kofuensis TaxID=103725 RepID=UPI0031ECBB43